MMEKVTMMKKVSQGRRDEEGWSGASLVVAWVVVE